MEPAGSLRSNLGKTTSTSTQFTLSELAQNRRSRCQQPVSSHHNQLQPATTQWASPAGPSQLTPPVGLSRWTSPMVPSRQTPQMGQSRRTPPVVLSQRNPPVGPRWWTPPVDLSRWTPPLGPSHWIPPATASSRPQLPSSSLRVSGKRRLLPRGSSVPPRRPSMLRQWTSTPHRESSIFRRGSLSCHCSLRLNCMASRPARPKIKPC